MTCENIHNRGKEKKTEAVGLQSERKEPRAMNFEKKPSFISKRQVGVKTAKEC